MIQFKLIRFPKKDRTEGELFFTNRKLCDTLEDIVRDRNADGDLDDEDEGKVYGETAIPYGIHELLVTMSPKFGREMTLVKDVPDFSGIRIHWLRTVKQSLGCIGVGKKNGSTLDNTHMTDKITALVKSLIAEGKRVYIEII